ncbi:tetratricopeptide repeat protein [Streptomyces goshikiensis]|uniref:tetratricopeptide repeat protein n=1 Tax=Streptomyces goshikiensis TaxID=1942 RepID=UPI0036FA4FCB
MPTTPTPSPAAATSPATSTPSGDTRKPSASSPPTLAALQRVVGPRHPRTLSSGNLLAQALLDLGRHQEAVDLHTTTLVARERALGPDHPDTRTSRYNLAAAQQRLQAEGRRVRGWRVRRVRP